MTRRILAVLTLTAAGVLAGCGTDTNSCAASSATWSPKASNSCDGSSTGQTLDVGLTICQLDCQSTPSCEVEVQGTQIHLDPIAHTCDESSCNIGASCAVNPIVTCHIQGLQSGTTYELLVGPDLTNGGSVVVNGSATSCSI
jgi:hypothetical protein